MNSWDFEILIFEILIVNLHWRIYIHVCMCTNIHVTCMYVMHMYYLSSLDINQLHCTSKFRCTVVNLDVAIEFIFICTCIINMNRRVSPVAVLTLHTRVVGWVVSVWSASVYFVCEYLMCEYLMRGYTCTYIHTYIHTLHVHTCTCTCTYIQWNQRRKEHTCDDFLTSIFHRFLFWDHLWRDFDATCVLGVL